MRHSLRLIILSAMLTWNQAFRSWAAEHTKSWLAYKIEVSATSIHFYLTDQAYPYRRRRDRIQRLSRGAVRADLPSGVVHKESVKPNKSPRKVRARSAGAA